MILKVPSSPNHSTILCSSKPFCTQFLLSLAHHAQKSWYLSYNVSPPAMKTFNLVRGWHYSGLRWHFPKEAHGFTFPAPSRPLLFFSCVFFSSCKWKLNWSVITQVPFLPFRGRYWESFTAVRFLTYPPKFIRKHTNYSEITSNSLLKFLPPRQLETTWFPKSPLEWNFFPSILSKALTIYHYDQQCYSALLSPELSNNDNYEK